jgi:hypothetical protein
MRIRSRLSLAPCAYLWLLAQLAAAAQEAAPIAYTVKFPEPAKHYALVEAAVPTGKQASVELMMPVCRRGSRLPFRKWLATTEELDHAEALAWFGLRFAPGEGGKTTWRLEARPDATAVQQERLRAWLGPTRETKSVRRGCCCRGPRRAGDNRGVARPWAAVGAP